MAEKWNESLAVEVEPEDWQVLVHWLRAIPDLDQADFSALADLDPSTVSRYENGHLVPRPRSLAKLARAAHVPPFVVEACLLPLIATLRRSSRPEDLEDLEEVAAAFLRSFSGVARPRLAALLLALAQLQTSPPPGPPSAADLARADELWERLEPCTPEELEFLIENAPEFQVWALAVRLAEESARAAADDPRRALLLAWLALRIVELSSTEPPFRSTLEGHVRTFLANALRVSSDLPGAERDLALAKEQIEAGQGAGADLLPAWRRLDLEASLCRDRRRWSEALDLLKRARAQAPPEAAGRILLKRSSVLVLMGEGERAVEVLREAAGLVEIHREPRLLAVLSFNLATTLNLLQRYPEAEALLPEVRERVLALGNSLDLVRYRWLEGQVAAGRGRSEEARVAFEEVLARFTADKIPYDAALVALELATLHLEQGRTAAVKRLAQGMVWIFEEQKVDEETQKALALFREAAAREAVTLDLARRVAAHLTRARQAPGLAFEG